MNEYKDFAYWVAERICNEDYDTILFTELALRKLHELGIVQYDGDLDAWVFNEVSE